MSTPENPLSVFDTHNVRHVLVGFQFSKDADEYKFTRNMGTEGTTVAGGCGAGVIIVNELSGTRFSIEYAEWEYNFYSILDGMATSNIGQISIVENIPFTFMDFLYKNVLPKLGDVSLSHVAFALKTYFIGSVGTGPEEIVAGNQYVFNVSNIVSNVATNAQQPSEHIMMTMGISQTVGQLPSYSNLYQMTLTHKDGELHKKIPTPDPVIGGLQLRSVEDGAKYPKRTERIDKSKPMKTLQDIFEAFEVELDEQKHTHKGQLQQWMRNIRDDHVDKIKVPPKQLKQKDADPLPMVYHVDLDDKYKSYIVDNRNIPHEQPEQDQTIKGIRVIGTDTSTTIVKMVENLLTLSKKIGEDANKPIPEIPKVSISVVRECDKKQHVYVIIKKIKQPVNKQGLNSGPGEGAIKPLTFYVNNIEKDREIISINTKFSYQTGDNVLEEHTDDYNANIVYGNREQVTFERKRDVPFFETMFSGNRMIGGAKCNSTEFGDLSCSLDGLENKQRTFYTVTMYGNPHLLNDVNRKPSEVANKTAGEANYYMFPEYYPMYMKLIVYQDAYKEQGGNPKDEDWLQPVHDFTNFYHISKVRNIFNKSTSSDVAMRGFVQKLEIRRTDEFM